MIELGALNSAMAGHGPTVFSIVETKKTGNDIVSYFKEKGIHSVLSKTL
jgi:shikimate kinase